MRTFLGLQLADIVTTLVFLSMGIAESNPLVDYLMGHLGTVPGLLLLKTAAIAIALLCNCAGRPKFLHRINYIYMAIVAINVLTILDKSRASFALGIHS